MKREYPINRWNRFIYRRVTIDPFSSYVQFSEYLGFVRTMDAFRGMKLVRKDGEKNYAVSIKVDFDTTKHLSDANIKRRKIIRDRLIAKENVRLDEERKKLEAVEAQKEKERFDGNLVTNGSAIMQNRGSG